MLAIAPAMAHDFWIEPSKFHARNGDRIALHLRVGQDFKGNNALYNPEQFERYVYIGPEGEQPVPGMMGDDPAGSIAVTGPGIYSVGYYSKRFDATFDTLEEFEQYLKMEGLERTLEQVRSRARIGKILEWYTRCAKSLVAGPGAESGRADHIFGFPLELVADTNPYREQNLRLRLLYRGQPLEDALVVAFNKATPLAKLRARTDKDGRVTFRLPQAGTWLITSVHQIPVAWYARGDWESFWASLTFELPQLDMIKAHRYKNNTDD